MRSEDAFETSLRAAGEAWQRGELGRRDAVELIAHALEVHMRRLVESAPRPGAKDSDAAVYVRSARVALNREEHDLERLYDEARHLWTSKFR